MFTYLTLAHKLELKTMIDSLTRASAVCEEKREFYMAFYMLNAFRDIIMTWSPNEFSEAYDRLSDWYTEYLDCEV